MGRPAKALSGYNRIVGSNPTLSAMKISGRYAFAVLLVLSTLNVDAGKVLARECTNTYTAQRGDSWWSIARKSGTTLNQILILNNAKLKTTILIGDEVCRPGANQSTRAKVVTPSTRVDVEKIIVSARECTNTYTAQRGDSWWSIARKSGTTLNQILILNNAKLKTTILIGDEVCRPGAKQPTAAVVFAAYTRNEIEKIIRDVWPDDLENRALAIAKRESNLSARAANNCCFGLFQIYYGYHKNWLPDVGVTSANQLLDPMLNALAAYKLYQRNNGWGPWE